MGRSRKRLAPKYVPKPSYDSSKYEGKEIDLCIEVCQRMQGGESLNQIVADSHMPTRATVWNWRQRQDFVMPDQRLFRDWIDDAEIERAGNLVEDAITRAREVRTEICGDRADMARISQARLEIDTYKWLAEKLIPSKYGKRLALTDKDGGPLTINVVHYVGNEVQSRLVGQAGQEGESKPSLGQQEGENVPSDSRVIEGVVVDTDDAGQKA